MKSSEFKIMWAENLDQLFMPINIKHLDSTHEYVSPNFLRFFIILFAVDMIPLFTWELPLCYNFLRHLRYTFSLENSFDHTVTKSNV